jgi:hypothetical protein
MNEDGTAEVRSRLATAHRRPLLEGFVSRAQCNLGAY